MGCKMLLDMKNAILIETPFASATQTAKILFGVSKSRKRQLVNMLKIARAGFKDRFALPQSNRRRKRESYAKTIRGFQTGQKVQERECKTEAIKRKQCLEENALDEKRQLVPTDVFLNIPYDKKFERLYLAYIAGVTAFGLVPRATLEIPTSTRRLDRIVHLLRKCPIALHDLSRVEIDRTPPSTPGFNMPFELGLSVAWAQIGTNRHAWFVLESRNYRLIKSLSDLNGTDVHIHNGRIDGVFRALANAFVTATSEAVCSADGADLPRFENKHG